MLIFPKLYLSGDVVYVIARADDPFKRLKGFGVCPFGQGLRFSVLGKIIFREAPVFFSSVFYQFFYIKFPVYVSRFIAVCAFCLVSKEDDILSLIGIRPKIAVIAIPQIP